MGKENAKPYDSFLSGADKMTPSGQPNDPAVSGTSESAGIAGQFGAFQGDNQKIQRAKNMNIKTKMKGGLPSTGEVGG